MLEHPLARQSTGTTATPPDLPTDPCKCTATHPAEHAEVWECAHMEIHAQLCPCIYICTPAPTRMYMHTHNAYIYKHAYAHTNTCTHVHMHTYTHAHTCAYAYTHMCTYPGSPTGSPAPLHPWLQPRPFHVLTAAATPKCTVPPRLLCEEIHLPPPKTTLLGCPSHRGHGGRPRRVPSLRQVWRELSFPVLPAWRWVFSPSLLPRRMRLPCQCVSRGPGPPGGCPVEDNAPRLLLHS